MSLPPLYALRAFEVAARLNSFSKAAETLNITPGAVSRHVRTLELWFDCEVSKGKVLGWRSLKPGECLPGS